MPAAIAAAALEVLLFVIDRGDVDIPSMALVVLGSLAGGLLAWALIASVLSAYRGGDEPRTSIERVAMTGRKLGDEVLRNPCWTVQDAVAEYQAWDAQARAEVRRSARRYLDRYGCATLDDLRTHEQISDAIRARVAELEWIASHIVQRLPDG